MSHYQTNKETIARNRRKRCVRNREYATSRMTPCIDCGYFHPAAMDWHHVDPSNKVEGGVSQLIRGGKSIESIEEEIQKCVCLCSNCHRIRHAEGE